MRAILIFFLPMLDAGVGLDVVVGAGDGLGVVGDRGEREGRLLTG